MAKWFEADKDGLAKLLRKRGIEFGVLELLQNALDEDVSEVSITLQKVPRLHSRYELTVTDDSSEGFKDLTHAYTLFAESEKKDDPLKRGRFNLGEKLVIALCKEAEVSTTKGTILFAENGERHRSKRKLERGSIFKAQIVMDRDEFSRVDQKLRSVLPPQGVPIYFNGVQIPYRTPLRTFMVNLPTVRADQEGNLTPTRRDTMVMVYEVISGEQASIYELGLPVVATGDRFHVNVHQKVPLNMSRDNVTPAYLREVRTAILNRTKDLVSEEDTTATWVKTALEDRRIEPEAVQAVMEKRFGKKRVVYDPSDREANARAIDRGATLIPGAAFSKSAWENIRTKDSQTRAAGVVYPTPKPFHPDGKPLKTLPEEEWTDGIRNIVAYARYLASELMGRQIRVTIANDLGWRFQGAYGQGELTINLARVGYSWFEQISDNVNHFLIHEFGHEYEANHLSERYHHALCDLGAKLARLFLDKPETIEEFHNGA